MCYILAKDVNKHGCTAWKTKPGNGLSSVKKELEEVAKGKQVQIVMISRPMAYGEYAPYHFVDTKEELIAFVKSM